MTQVHESSVMARAWGEVAQDIALTGLKVELDGLTALFSMFGASGLLTSGLAPRVPSVGADDLDMDNVPV